mmetsp:Transcript_34105/g.77248  ORF Transcript_34105/g.77248 Transcript_34105/m.77248 type:complete len:219 (+) Transcript_34105:429-1085(+)
MAQCNPRSFPLAVKMESCRFHPSVICVARVVNIAAIDLFRISTTEKYFDHLHRSLLLGRVHYVEDLLSKFTPHRHRNQLACIYHASRKRPRASVAPHDSDHLRLSARRVETCYNWISGMVWTPLAQVAAARHAGASTRIYWPVRNKAQRSLIRCASRPLLTADRGWISRIGPTASHHCSVVLEYMGRCERRRRIAGKWRSPWHLIIAHGCPSGVKREP